MGAGKKHSTEKLMLSALCTAILAVLAQVHIPMPFGVPLSLQTFAVALCGYILGWKFGVLSVIGYILLGSVGIPVFSGLRGGISVLIGPTGGFLTGFIVLACACGISRAFIYPASFREPSKDSFWKKKKALLQIAFGLAGLVICHGMGILWFVIVTANRFSAAFVSVSVPFLFKDILSVIGGQFLARMINGALIANSRGFS